MLRNVPCIRLMKFFNSKLIYFFKVIFTAVLAVGLLSLIVSDYRKLRQKYPGNSFFSFIFVEQEKVKEKAKLITLNQFIPRYYENLFHWSNGAPEVQSLDNLPTYTRYYEKIMEYMPQLPEGYGLLAFCYYYAGKKAEAIALYEKALILNPHVLWFYYNLGVIHYKDRQYAQAMAAFQKALNVDLNLSVKFILSSKLYQDILRERSLGAADIEKGIDAIRQNTQILLGLSAYHLQNPGGKVIAPLEENLYLKII